MRVDVRRMPWPDLILLLKDVARELEQRARRPANPQYRDDRGLPGGFPSGYGGGPGPRGNARGKKRFGRQPYRGGPGSPPRPAQDEDFNR